MQQRSIALVLLIIVLHSSASTSSADQFNNVTAQVQDLHIGFLPNLNGNNADKYIHGAFRCGLRDANHLLRSSGYRLVSWIYNNGGSVLRSIRGMTEMYINGTIAFIGPEDSCTIESNVVTAWNIPMVAFVSTNLFCHKLFILLKF